MVYKSVKGLNGLDSCLASCAPSQESSGVFLDAASSSLSSATPSSPPSANPSRALSIGSAQRGGGLDVAAKLGVMSRFKAAFQGLYEVAASLACMARCACNAFCRQRAALEYIPITESVYILMQHSPIVKTQITSTEAKGIAFCIIKMA